jgi:hypothetical protein
MPLFYKLDGLGKDTARVAGRLEALRQAMQTHPDGPMINARQNLTGISPRLFPIST